MNKQLCFLLLGAGLWAGHALPASGQVNVAWTGDVGDFNDPSNWEGGFGPIAIGGESGVINNGGTAFVDMLPDLGPGGMILGQNAGNSGTLEILSGGTLVVDPEGGDAPGTVVVGQAGEGHLIVERGGTLTALGLSSAGATNSSITLGQTSGTGSATVTIDGNANLARTTRLVGPDVNFSANGLSLAGQHQLIAEITGATHSAIDVSGTATLGGSLTVEFNGHTPGLDSAWTLVDAAQINGSFASVSADTQLDPGYVLAITNRSGGMNGQIAELAVEGRLMLSIDRSNGAATLSNLTAESFDIDGYLIGSSNGVLTPGGWSSFQADGQAGWEESNPAPTHLGELNLAGSRVLDSSTSVELGSIFAPTEFGQAADLTFEYHEAGGQSVSGLIDYTGPHNNLVLIVDPETGEAALQNQSTFDIEIDGYLITSNSASLDPDGWMSLADSGMDGWSVANPAANHVGELNLEGESMLGGRSNAISLGTLFDIDNAEAQQDLAFEFHIAGGETMAGVVEYGEIPPDMMEGLTGDFSGNGVVEQADLNLVLLNWGEPGSPPPTGWNNDLPEGNIDQGELNSVLLNWGAMAQGGLAGSAAVPEPTTWLLLLVAGSAALALRRRR